MDGPIQEVAITSSTVQRSSLLAQQTGWPASSAYSSNGMRRRCAAERAAADNPKRIPGPVPARRYCPAWAHRIESEATRVAITALGTAVMGMLRLHIDAAGGAQDRMLGARVRNRFKGASDFPIGRRHRITIATEYDTTAKSSSAMSVPASASVSASASDSDSDSDSASDSASASASASISNRPGSRPSTDRRER